MLLHFNVSALSHKSNFDVNAIGHNMVLRPIMVVFSKGRDHIILDDQPGVAAGILGTVPPGSTLYHRVLVICVAVVYHILLAVLKRYHLGCEKKYWSKVH